MCNCLVWDVKYWSCTWMLSFSGFSLIEDMDGRPTGLVLWTVWAVAGGNATETVNFNKESWDFLKTLHWLKWRLYRNHVFAFAISTKWIKIFKYNLLFWWLVCRGVSTYLLNVPLPLICYTLAKQSENKFWSKFALFFLTAWHLLLF